MRSFANLKQEPPIILESGALGIQIFKIGAKNI